MINNEAGGKPVPMTYNMNPKGGTDPDAKKPGSGQSMGTNKYGLNNPDTYYRVSGGPTLGTPSGGPEESASSKNSRSLANGSAPNMRTTNSGRNTA